MAIVPVIVRELRAQARQPMTYWLRIIGALMVSGAIAFALWRMGQQQGQTRGAPPFVALPNPILTFGTTLFGKLNLFIFLAIWLFVPLATADAVSRERREGTLVLLYLTELRSLGIVVGKAFVHILRSASLFLTMAPWLVLPLVFGGVGLRDIAMALLLNLASLLLAEAAGLLASTFPRDWLKVVILAELFALLLFLALLEVHGAVLRNMVRAGVPTRVAFGTPVFWNSRAGIFWWLCEPRAVGDGFIGQTTRLLEFTTDSSFGESDDGYGLGSAGLETHWGDVWTRLLPAAQVHWFCGVIGMVGGSALVLLVATRVGAWRVERSWQDAPPGVMVSDLRRKLFSPRFGVRALRRRLSHSLSANPIGWLQHYSPAARLVKWSWCLFFILVEILLSFNSSDLYRAQAWLGLLLLLGLTFSATGSFREELETGAFELWLVTPLRERQIISGRLRGLWRQFLPAFVVYAAGSIYLTIGWKNSAYPDGPWLSLARTMAGFIALPMIGLYFSVQRWNFFTAWLAASVLGLLPAFIGRAFGATDASMIAMQFAVAISAAVLLLHRLRRRQFMRR